MDPEPEQHGNADLAAGRSDDVVSNPSALRGADVAFATHSANLARRLYLAAEFAVLFFVMPTLYIAGVFQPPLIPLLVLGALVCAAALLLDQSFDRRQLWKVGRALPEMRRVVPSFIGLAGLLALAVAMIEPGEMFSFVRHAPQRWAIIMLLYPLFSVYPQEIIFRTFLFHRYRALAPRPWMIIAMSALAFGYAHIIFGAWISVILSTAAGGLFAWTYFRTRSTLIVAIEHALYGDFIFTIGLGGYFYTGGS